MSILDASYKGNLAVLKSLKDKGEDLTVTDTDGNNALHIACFGAGHIETIKWLLDEGFALESKGNAGYTPFLSAAYGGNLDVLKFLKERNADTRSTSNDGENALHRACFGAGHIETIKWLLDEGFALESKGNAGYTPFLSAADGGNLDVLKFLKERNADTRSTSNHGENALHIACLGAGHIETIKWLLDEGFALESKGNAGYTPFLSAAYGGNLDVLKFLKERNADTRSTSNDGENALHRACFGAGHIETIKWLLDEGFALESKGNAGYTPFLSAADGGNLDVLKFLKERNADTRSTSNHGENALHIACLGAGHIETVKWLLDEGFALESKTNAGYTPFLYAAAGGNLDVLKFLKERNADTRSTLFDGSSALHLACLGKGDIDTVTWLLHQGFSMQTPNSSGRTPFYYALNEGHQQVVRLFLHLNPEILNMASDNG